MEDHNSLLSTPFFKLSHTQNSEIPIKWKREDLQCCHVLPARSSAFLVASPIVFPHLPSTPLTLSIVSVKQDIALHYFLSIFFFSFATVLSIIARLKLCSFTEQVMFFYRTFYLLKALKSNLFIQMNILHFTSTIHFKETVCSGAKCSN